MNIPRTSSEFLRGFLLFLIPKDGTRRFAYEATDTLTIRIPFSAATSWFLSRLQRDIVLRDTIDAFVELFGEQSADLF